MQEKSHRIIYRIVRKLHLSTRLYLSVYVKIFDRFAFLRYGYGIGESLEFWTPQEALAGDLYRIITIDLPGHGLSASGTQPYDPAKFADVCWQFLDAIGVDKAVLVGNSMGGGISILMADSQPQRVEKVLLANAATLGRATVVPFRLMTLPLLGKLLTKPSNQGVEQQLKAIFHDPQVVTDEIRTIATRNVMSSERAKAFLSTLRLMTDFGGQKQSIIDTALSALKQLNIPVLFIHGRQDTVLPYEHSVAAQKLVANSKLVIFDDCGHTPQIEKPGLFNDELKSFIEN
jgi:pimeloyl-ACP methyl ester carboxylesterase